MYSQLVNHYYELATLFYEVGWCPSFHFAYRMLGESFSESIRRHEYYLAGFLGLKPGSKVLDVGCGIGGPYRNIARFTKWDITGVTLNEYQVSRANTLCKQQGLDKTCRSIQGDFMKLSSFFPKATPSSAPQATAGPALPPFLQPLRPARVCACPPPVLVFPKAHPTPLQESFDGAYAIEATCHAPERRGVYGEIFKLMKPGAIFACYEWCLTDGYDGSPLHKKYKKQIEEGDGLPDLCHTSEVSAALRDCGFEIIHSRDMAEDPNQETPWYITMTPALNPFSQRIQFTRVGMFLTAWGLKLLEFLYVVPSGTSKVQMMLQQAALGLAGGGSTKSFTPMYLAVCRKPGPKK
uniref:SAM-dependent methyltransferase Erg6/SMT-type domain-containing protein n=2 Tax=Hemiselmis tepida TaxID=464990 RepID=A0A7S0YYQ9_9CRYP|mmetsp:Transcript_30894/g.78197  ORF Transcript_30894/g.78197 Transcript_30894/m.78197 type:complete len:351 (+) Transcript_30894:453-1505(+)